MEKILCVRSSIQAVMSLGIMIAVSFFMFGNAGAAIAAEYVSIAIEPEDVGVLYSEKTQQFRAYGWTASGQKIDITNDVDWSIDPVSLAFKGQDTTPGSVATISATGLATVKKSWGRVSVNACLPKGCAKSFGGGGGITSIVGALLRPSYVVTVSNNTPGLGSILPLGESEVKQGRSLFLDLAPSADHEVVAGDVGGTCPKGSIVSNYTQYKTGAIKEACTVEAGFSHKPEVTASVNNHPSCSGSTISPDGSEPIYVFTGAEQEFILSADNDCEASSVTTDCPGGTFSGVHNNRYTVGPIGDPDPCDVVVNFSPLPSFIVSSTVDVTNSNGSISPAPTSSVKKWGTQTFTLTPASGDYKATNVTGGCPSGTLSYDKDTNNSTYVTGEIVGNCTVVAHFTDNTVTVNSSVTGGNGNNGTVTPYGDSVKVRGEAAVFTLNPASGHAASLVSDDCGEGGTFSNNDLTYTTTVLNDDCDVIFEFLPQPYTLTVSVSGDGGVYSGSISSSEIKCGSAAEDLGVEEVCAYDFLYGTTVQLTALDGFPWGYVLQGWTGCDTPPGGNVCEVTIDGPKTVTATFSE